MKTTKESLSKGGGKYPRSVFCAIILALTLSLFSAYKAQGNPPPLIGTYVIREFSGSFHGWDPNGGWGSNDEWNLGNILVTFDGAGNFTATSSENGVQRQIGEVSSGSGEDYVLSNKFTTTPISYSDPAESGTYDIAEDGRFTLYFQDDDGPGSVSGWVTPDGQTVVFGEGEYESAKFWARVSLGVGVKKGTAMPSSISATYVIHEFLGGFHGTDPNGGWGANDERSLNTIEIVFNNDNTFYATSSDYWINRHIFEVPKDFGGNQVLSNKFITTSGTEGPSGISGTYTITPEGQFTLNFQEDGQPASVSGWVSENGQTVVFGQTEYESGPGDFWGSVSLGVGVKKGIGLNLSSVYGTYQMYQIESGVGGQDPNGGWGAVDELILTRGWVSINPDGTWSVTLNEYNIDRQISEIAQTWGDDQVLSNTFQTTLAVRPGGEAGTYTYSSGTLTLHMIDDGEPSTVTVYLSEDGQIGIFGFKEFTGGPTDFYGDAGVGVAVRKAVQDISPSFSLAGVVSHAGPATGTLKVLAFYNNAGTRYPYAQVVGTPYLAPWNPTGGTQEYTITGLTPGTYQLVAYIDANDVGPREPGEPVATRMGLTVTTDNLQGQDLTLQVPAFQFSGQEKVLPFNMNNVPNLTFWARIPDAAGVEVTGPGIAAPITPGRDFMDGSVWSSAVPVSNLVGGAIQTGNYQFTATPALGGSPATTDFNLTSVPATPPAAGLVSPYNPGNPNEEIFLTDNKPTFTWNAVTGAQVYKLRIDQMIDSQWVRIYDSRWEVTGASHTAQMPLPSGVPLRWYVDAFDGLDWPSTTAMSRSVRQRFTIAGPRSVSGTVNVPLHSGAGPIKVMVYQSTDGTFNPSPENLLGTDIINPDEYNSGVTHYVIPNLPVGALVYVAARWDADGDGVPSEGDYLGKVGPLTVTADDMLDINVSLLTRYAYQEGAPFFAWCSVQASHLPTAGGGSEVQTSLNARIFDPDGSIPDSVTLTASGPGVNYTFTSADYQQGLNAYSHGIAGQPAVGEYTFTVTDTEGKTATSHCYYGGGTTIPLPDSTTLQASDDGSGNVILSWGGISGYQGNLFYRARIFDSTGNNVICTSDFVSQTSVMVPPDKLALVQQEATPKWRVEAFDNYSFPASNNRAVCGRVSWAIENTKPYFIYATIFHRKDGGGDKTMIQARVAAPGGILPASIQSVDVYNPQGALLYSLQAGNYDPAFNQYAYVLAGTPASGVYRFVVTDVDANTKTSYDYVSSAAIPMVDATTFQTSGDLSGPVLSWGAPATMDRPLYYRAIVEEDLGDGVYSRVWASNRITDTFVQVPPGMIPSGNIVWYVRTLDDQDFVHYSNQGRSARVNLADNHASTSTKPYFRRAAVFERHEPGGGPYLFMDAMVQDPNGWVPETIAVLKVTDLDGVEYDLLPPNGVYSGPVDQEFIRRIPGTPKQGVYTFTLQDEEGNTAVTRDWVGAAAAIPLVPSMSIVIMGDPLAPTISWSGVSGYQGTLYYRIWVQDSQGNSVHRSAREPFTVQTIPTGKLMPGRFYSVRVEAQDHWIWTVYNGRANSDFVTWFTGQGVVGGSVSGRVTDSLGNPIPNVQVNTQTEPCGGQNQGLATTDQNGEYLISGLPEGNLYLSTCAACSGLNYLDEVHNNVPMYECANATAVYVTTGQETTGIDFSLDMGGRISGFVFDESGVTPIPDIFVEALTYDSSLWVGMSSSAQNGYYSFVVPPGVYKVTTCVSCNNSFYLDEYYNNTSDPGAAAPVTVIAGEDTPGINFTLTATTPPGDLNGDRNVTLTDAIMALQIVAGMSPEGLQLSGDVNADGRIGLVDVIHIFQVVTGLRSP